MWPFQRISPNDLGGRSIILCSHGRTGTTWIGTALGVHPDFLCSHSAYKMHSAPGEKLFIPDVLKEPRARALQMSIDEFYQHLIDYKRAKHYVSIHAFQINTVRRRLWRQNTRYVVVNMIRHPIVRLVSFVKRKLQNAEIHDPASAEREKEWVLRSPLQSLARQSDLKTPSDYFFFSSLWTFWVESIELRSKYPVIRMEDLTTDKKAFRDFFHRITEGTSECSDKYVDKVFDLGRINDIGPAIDPRSTWNSLTQWQRDAWIELDKKLGFVEVYAKHGYDLSFTRK